ncbi:NAD(P)H-binding protein [Candidatus Frankia alpina]|uniref:Oxidoreductase n=1 Tax=Candidatus Frankia alpina TaxID=2699483 RepID=A0A4S5BNN0_9ACTN|nr:NAD(P)H-binding protein [Candidatus Frankia alpina]THJ31348.1 oxidoreductase [Candidatus Frankia alpina]
MAFSLIVVGATGNVGRGIVAAARQRGWEVTAVDRDTVGFDALPDEFAGVKTVVGSVADAEQAAELAARLDLASVDAVAVNIPWTPTPVLATTWEQAENHLGPYLQLHLSAATTFLPVLSAGAVYLGMGGGMADIPARGMGVVSMAQAAQRMLYRHLEREARASEVLVREVMIRAMVHGFGQPGEPGPGMLGSDVIGQRVCDVLVDAKEQEVVVVLEA